MNRHVHATEWITRVMLVTLLATASTQEFGQRILGADDTEARERAERLEVMKQAAAEHEIIVEADEPQKLTLEIEPLLRWTNPVRGTTDGAVFVWTSKGCPEVIAGIYKWRGQASEPDMEYEFKTLSQCTIVAARLGQTVWTPRRNDVVREPIAAAPPPDDAPATRLRQMRALAREFTAVQEKPNNTSELRLLTQPIFRYASTRSDVLDGAIFAFAEATDPEVLLLIEARATDTGYEWQRAFARMTSLPLRARYKNREVWSVTDCWSQVTDRRQPYTAFFQQKVGQ